MLLIILVLVYVGILFKRLAERHKKNPTAFAVLGIVVFLIGLFSLSFLLGLILAFTGFDLENLNLFVLEIIGYLLGGVTVWLVYFYLNKKWTKNKSEVDYEVIDNSWIDESESN